MPLSLLQQLGAGGPDWREWRASSGAVHRLRICSNDVLGEPSSRLAEVPALAASESDFAPLHDTIPGPQTVASLLEGRDTPTSTIYRSICARSDIRDLFGDRERLHEVPFTMRVEGRIVRGVIDCVVRTAPGRITVLEFKTGCRRDGDDVQLDVYRRAAERLFPGEVIDAQLVYAAEDT